MRVFFPFLFCFVFVLFWVGGGLLGPLHTRGHRDAVCQARELQHRQRGGRWSPSVRRSEHAQWRGSALSCLNLLRSKQQSHGTPWVSCGRGRSERSGTWLVSQPRCTEKQSTGQPRPAPGGLSGGLWDNLWPYGLGLETRRAYHFRCNHFGHAFADSP